MSQRTRGSRLQQLIADADLFFFYLRGGRCESQADAVIRQAVGGQLVLRTSSEVYDDAVSAIRSEGVDMRIAREFVSDMRSIPHESLPMSAEIAEEALLTYAAHGGRRRMGYFDCFHVATARRFSLPLLTSDGYIIERASALGVDVLPLEDWGKGMDS